LRTAVESSPSPKGMPVIKITKREKASIERLKTRSLNRIESIFGMCNSSCVRIIGYQQKQMYAAASSLSGINMTARTDTDMKTVSAVLMSYSETMIGKISDAIMGPANVPIPDTLATKRSRDMCRNTLCKGILWI